MVKLISRRKFLAGAGIGMAAQLLGLGAAAANQGSSTGASAPGGAALPQSVVDLLAAVSANEGGGNTPQAELSALEAPIAPQDVVNVGVVRATTVRHMVNRAIALAGGFPGLQPGAFVLIKINQNSNHPHPGTTNPEVLAAVIDEVKKYSPRRIVVADRSNGAYATLDAMKTTGTYQAAINAGAQVIPLETRGWAKLTPAGLKHWPSYQISNLVLRADYVISVPVVKTHSGAGFTMSIKNWVGILNLDSRGYMHSSSPTSCSSAGCHSTAPTQASLFGAKVAEIHLARRPNFVVLDATKVFVDGGPSSGKLRSPNMVIASRDIVAADVTGLALLKYLGTTPRIQNTTVWKQEMIARAIELGLGVSGPSGMSLQMEGLTADERLRLPRKVSKV